jgi:hypothetical protein
LPRYVLSFLAELLGDWAIWKLDRLSPRMIRVLNAVFVALCVGATALFVLALLVLLQ